jgi:hypothetical protein
MKHHNLSRVLTAFQYAVFSIVAPQMEVDTSDMLQDCHGSSYTSIRVGRAQKFPTSLVKWAWTEDFVALPKYTLQ